MKKFIPILLSILLLSAIVGGCVGAEEAPPTQDDEVKFYLQERVTEISSEFSTRTVWTYDDQWRITSWTSYTNGEVETEAYFDYNQDGSVTTFTVKGSDVVTEMLHTFDENGNSIRVEEFENSICYKITDNIYDSQNRLISSESTYPLKDYYRSTSIQNTYDEQDNLIKEEEVRILVDGTVYNYLTERTYDDQGRVLTEHILDPNKENNYRYSYEGNVQTRISLVDGKPEEGRLISTYDDHGNLLMEEESYSDVFFQRNYYTYVGTDGSIVSGKSE